MSHYINLQQTEYDEACTRLHQLHQKAVLYLSELQQELLQLTSQEGDFYVSQVSAKVQLLISTLQSNPLALLTAQFENTELALDTYLQTMTELDAIKM